jgi:hypothetical protein
MSESGDQNPIAAYCPPGCTLHPENWKTPEDEVFPSQWKTDPGKVALALQYLGEARTVNGREKVLRDYEVALDQEDDRRHHRGKRGMKNDPHPFQTSRPGFTPAQQRIFVQPGEEQ